MIFLGRFWVALKQMKTYPQCGIFIKITKPTPHMGPKNTKFSPKQVGGRILKTNKKGVPQLPSNQNPHTLFSYLKRLGASWPPRERQRPTCFWVRGVLFALNIRLYARCNITNFFWEFGGHSDLFGYIEIVILEFNLMAAIFDILFNKRTPGK